MAHITLVTSGRFRYILKICEGELLSRSIFLAGLFETVSLCSGLGRCKRCSIRFLPKSSVLPPPSDSETEILGTQAISEGWRLACRHAAAHGMLLELPPLHIEKIAQPDPPPQAYAWTAYRKLAVDFGSTTVHLLPLSGGFEANSALFSVPFRADAVIRANPQAGAGSDVISRLAFAADRQNCLKLHKLSIDGLTRMFPPMAAFEEMVIAGNPAMLCLLLDKPCAGLSSAPYRLEYLGGCAENIDKLPPIWTSPLISPFVGGDISAGYAALALNPQQKTPYPFILADMGTNGEFLLAIDEHTAFAVSLPLGPALEGIGMDCGAEAKPGVIVSFELTPGGLQYKTIGNMPATFKATGISATGYISLLDRLRKCGLLDQNGHFASDHRALDSPLSGISVKLSSAVKNISGVPAFFVTDKLYASARDIEELLKIKAAFSVALETLLDIAGLKPAGLRAVYLAGAFGEHVDKAALAGLGFIPRGLLNKTIVAGNTSLAGAALLALKPDLRQKLSIWATKVISIDLAGQPGFQDKFTNAMNFGRQTEQKRPSKGTE